MIGKDARSFRRLPDSFQGRSIHGLGFDRGGPRGRRHQGGGRRGPGDVRRQLEHPHRPHRPGALPRCRTSWPASTTPGAVIYQRLGIATVATVTWTTEQITGGSSGAGPPRVVRPTGDLMLVERTLPDAWAGRRLADLGFSNRIRLVALVRAGQPLLVDADTVGHDGDTLHVMVHKDAADELDATRGRLGRPP